MIRAATEKDIDDIFDARLSCAVNKKTIAANIEKIRIVELDGFKMGALILVSGSDCEIHILCPRISVRKSRDMCLFLLGRMRDEGFSDAYTSVDIGHKKAYNLAIKLGFNPVATEGGITTLKRCLWA